MYRQTDKQLLKRIILMQQIYIYCTTCSQEWFKYKKLFQAIENCVYVYLLVLEALIGITLGIIFKYQRMN